MAHNPSTSRSDLGMRYHLTHHRHLCAAAAALLLFNACAADLAAPVPTTDPSRLFWELGLNHHAVNLLANAPYDTVQLVATPRTVNGDALTDQIGRAHV